MNLTRKATVHLLPANPQVLHLHQVQKEVAHQEVKLAQSQKAGDLGERFWLNLEEEVQVLTPQQRR